jgi:hypothetical protein
MIVSRLCTGWPDRLCDRVNSWYRPGGLLTAAQVTHEYWQLASSMLGLS